MKNILACLALLMLTNCATNDQPAEVISTQRRMKQSVLKGDYYLVRNGDTLGSISKRFNVSPAEILKLNKLGDATLVPGQRLLLKARNKQEEQRLSDDIVVKSLDDVSQPIDGLGLNEQMAEIPANDLSGTLNQPVMSDPSIHQPVLTRSGTYASPVQGNIIKSFGQQPDGSFNKGVNIAAPKGIPVKAISDGIVKYAGSKAEGYGKMIMLKHGDGKISTYAHLNSIDVKPDAIVTAGSKIGTVGSTGGVTQPQLNLQIRGIDKQPIDPSSLIPELG